MRIEVKHNIGDIVEHKLAEIKYMVIGYEYIDSYGLRYICVEGEKGDQRYVLGCEIKPINKSKIGFISFEN